METVFLDLPDETLLHILSFLTHGELWVHTRSLCRRLRNLSFDTRLWKSAWHTKNGSPPKCLGIDQSGVSAVRVYDEDVGPVFRVKEDQIPLLAWLFDRCEQLNSPIMWVVHHEGKYYTSRSHINRVFRLQKQAMQHKDFWRFHDICVHEATGIQAWDCHVAVKCTEMSHYRKCTYFNRSFMAKRRCAWGVPFKDGMTDEDFEHTTNYPSDLSRTLRQLFGLPSKAVFHDKRWGAPSRINKTRGANKRR